MDSKIELTIMSDEKPSLSTETVRNQLNPYFGNIKTPIYFRGTMDDLTNMNLKV